MNQGLISKSEIASVLSMSDPKSSQEQPNTGLCFIYLHDKKLSFCFIINNIVAQEPKPCRLTFLGDAKNDMRSKKTKSMRSPKQRISIYCAKITFNTIKYLLEGQSYFTIRNQWMSTKSVKVPLFPRKNITYKVLRTKSVDIRYTCFTFIDRTPFLIGVEPEAFDRMCALEGII